VLIWAARNSQGTPTLVPVDPPDMPHPQLGRPKTDTTGKPAAASPKGSPAAQN
jgi:hypothetical protein